MPTASSFTRIDPHHQSRLTSKRRLTRFACTGRRGDALCRFLHKSDNDRTPSPSRPAGTESEAAAAPEKPRSPSPAPKRRPGRGRSKSPRATPAACCVHAAAASDAGHTSQGKGLSTRANEKVLFVSRPETKSIPIDGLGGSLLAGQDGIPPATQIRKTAPNRIQEMPGPWRPPGFSNRH